MDGLIPNGGEFPARIGESSHAPSNGTGLSPRPGATLFGPARRGATAAEALAAELHREIAIREGLERRLADAEQRLAVRSSGAEPEDEPIALSTALPANFTPEAEPVVPAPAPPLAPAEPAAVAEPASSAETQPGESVLAQQLIQAELRLVEAEQRSAEKDHRLAEIEIRLADSERRFEASEQRFAYLMTGSPLGFFEYNNRDEDAYFSPRYKEMLGYRADELPDLKRTFKELLHPEDANTDWLAEREQLGEGVSRFTRSFRMRHRDGTYRWIESTGVETVDPVARKVRVLGFHRDITARKALEERLHQSEERFNLIITSSPLGFFDADLVTGRAFYSPLWKSMLGYRPEELPDTQQTWLDLVHPDDRGAAVAVHAQREFGENRRAFSHAVRLRHKEGHHRWVQASGIDFFSPDGRLLRTLGFHADIDALKTAEEALATEKEFLGVTLDSISDGVITTDPGGHVTYLNVRAEILCGLRGSEAIGVPIEEFYRLAGAQSRRQADNPVRAVLTTGLRAAPHDPAHLTSPGRPESVIADNAAPIVDPAGRMTGAVLVFHDITDRHRAAEEIQKAGRIESLGVLAGGIAHDFNNLLTAMLGNLSVARSAELPVRTIESLDRAEKACWRARDLTGQLLTFSRGGEPVRKTLALPDIMERAVRGALLNHPGIGVQYQCQPDLPAIEADEGQIVQVIHNLALNAAQAMPGAGMLRVRAGLANSPAGLAAVEEADTAAGAYIEIVLQDNGSGIATENLSKIFDPFFSTRTNGTGLGLAIAYSIVRKHEGVIRVESKLGAGSTFTVYLPVSPQAMPPAREKPLPPPPPRPTGRVLFMDDDPDILELGGAVLQLLDYEPVLTRDGNEALAESQAARAPGRPFAAVILDLTIPGGMGGKETMRRLREIDPGVRAIVSSGYSNDAVLADFRAHGFVAMVAKPYRMEDLARALTEAISGLPAAR
jgi:two-component system cell cycle sensor histidine kinase/response regulator CckA